MSTTYALNISVSLHILESSDDGPREGLSDSDGEQNPLADPAERYFHGLLRGKKFSRANVKIIEVQGRGRGATAAKNFRAGDFVCEYASCVKPKKASLAHQHEQRYAALGLGCYELDACHQGQWFTFDAIGTINDPGRYINHASCNTNLVLMKPVMMAGRLRIGFVAKRNISKGEELFYDYGVRDKDIPWLVSDGKAMANTKQMKPTQDQPAAAHSTKNRLKLKCPIKDCPSQQLRDDGFVKLSQHLKQFHGIEDQGQRQNLCANARQVCIS